MHFELYFSKYRAIIFSLELNTLTYFILGLSIGIVTLLAYNYYKISLGGKKWESFSDFYF